MWEHHRRAIDQLARLFREDPRYLALIVGGSIVKGWADETSDVDVMLVARDDEFVRVTDAGTYHYVNSDVTDYPGGYVDGKIIDKAFLRDVAERGSDAARSAFWHASVAYSHDSEIDELVEKIPRYPEADQARRIETFFSHVVIMNWYVGEAVKRDDPYLLMHATSDLVLYAARLILAFNHRLFPYHKWMMQAVQEAPDKPPQFETMAEDLLRDPSRERAQALTDLVLGFRDWGVDSSRSATRFIEDTEWGWRYGRTTPDEW
jgi:predicted nucleotidyltransferase